MMREFELKNRSGVWEKETALNEIYLKPTWLPAPRGNKIFQN